MTLPLRDLTRIAEAVIREHDPALTFVGVASNDGESGRVELLVRVAGCHSEPCTLSLNVSRDAGSRFEAELIDQLRTAMDTHATRGHS